MPQLNKSFVRVRFRFGNTPVKARQRYDTFSQVVKNIAITYAENYYEIIRDELTQGVKDDVTRELVNLASLYRRHIIGANGSQSRPAGVIRSVIGGAKPLALASVLPAWAPRTAEYLERKFNAGAGNGWFDNRKWNSRGWNPDLTGHLFDESRADVWEEMFGPIKVSFRRNNKGTQVPEAIFKGRLNHTQLQLGTLSVSALSKITPQMLPGLSAGQIGIASSLGNPRLIGLVYDYDHDLGVRLGNLSRGRYRPGEHGLYRPTLEPFLGYFLTRSIPAAISRRIQKGTLQRITRSS